ncbi:MAG: LacI family DNA-binding transcriptional regulator, partial [Chloroflexota bacterium]
MPTLTEVAKRAGVSTATVSKVLSNTPYFTEETRQKVMQAVEEIGYIPNLAARALSTGKTHIIGVVFPYIFDTVFTDPLVMEILQGIETVCREQGCSVLLSTPRIDDGEVENSYVQLIRSGYLDGIIALDNVPVASVIP